MSDADCTPGREPRSVAAGLYFAPVVLLTLQQHCNMLAVGFWATVCKTVHPMLLDCCLSVCLSVCPVLSVTFVHCGQTVGRIKMKLGMRVGLGPGHNVLDGDPLPQRGTASPRLISVAAKWLHGSRCHLVRDRMKNINSK